MTSKQEPEVLQNAGDCVLRHPLFIEEESDGTILCAGKLERRHISCGEGALLVDAGISCRRISRSLADLGEELGKIAGILLTHEHADHVKGLRILTKNTGAPVYATAPVLRYLEENALVPLSSS